MTKSIKHCAWCGGAIPEAEGPGRPRRYCRRSHRQRAFEARRSGEDRGLRPGEAVVPASALAALGDARYLLEAALEDGEADLAGDPDIEDLKAAYEALALTAAGLLAIRVEASALGPEI